MKGELKAGGLALVYGLHRDVHHNGKAVRLIDLESEESAITFAIMNDLDEPERWWRVTGLLPHDRVSKVKARNLLPIDGDDHQERDQLAKDKPREVVA